MLDGDSPLIKLNATTGKWCCMLCKRQFPTEKLLGTHLAGSTLHRTNLAEAEASGRIRGGSSAPPPAATKRPLPSETSEHPASKSSRWGERGEVAEPSCSSDAGGSAAIPERKMSALEQMELFEKRLKVQAQRAPAKEEKGEEEQFKVDSNCARTINNQMDWECSACGQFNFARSLTCHSCRAHVGPDTKYLTNRLKEMKCAAHRATPSPPSSAACPPAPAPSPTRHLQARALCKGLRERRCARWGSAARPQRGAKREARWVWAFGPRLLESVLKCQRTPRSGHRGTRGWGMRRGDESVISRVCSSLVLMWLSILTIRRIGRLVIYYPHAIGYTSRRRGAVQRA